MSLTAGAKNAFDPLALDDTPKVYLPLNVIPFAARKAELDFTIQAFHRIIESSLARALTTKAELKEQGWDPKKNPDPATGKEILSHISTLDPEKARAKIEAKKYARCKI